MSGQSFLLSRRSQSRFYQFIPTLAKRRGASECITLRKLALGSFRQASQCTSLHMFSLSLENDDVFHEPRRVVEWFTARVMHSRSTRKRQLSRLVLNRDTHKPKRPIEFVVWIHATNEGEYFDWMFLDISLSWTGSVSLSVCWRPFTGNRAETDGSSYVPMICRAMGGRSNGPSSPNFDEEGEIFRAPDFFNLGVTNNPIHGDDLEIWNVCGFSEDEGDGFDDHDEVDSCPNISGWRVGNALLRRQLSHRITTIAPVAPPCRFVLFCQLAVSSMLGTRPICACVTRNKFPYKSDLQRVNLHD